VPKVRAQAALEAALDEDDVPEDSGDVLKLRAQAALEAALDDDDDDAPHNGGIYWYRLMMKRTLVERLFAGGTKTTNPWRGFNLGMVGGGFIPPQSLP